MNFTININMEICFNKELVGGKVGHKVLFNISLLFQMVLCEGR